MGGHSDFEIDMFEICLRGTKNRILPCLKANNYEKIYIYSSSSFPPGKTSTEREKKFYAGQTTDLDAFVRQKTR
jgi:hypothetical protein